MGSNFQGVKIPCYVNMLKEIFVDINFHGCFILCVLVYLPKYIAIAMETTQFSSVIRGHHIYKKVWEPIHGQILQYEMESSNTFNPVLLFP